jgi:hypothetical protein
MQLSIYSREATTLTRYLYTTCSPRNCIRNFCPVQHILSSIKQGAIFNAEYMLNNRGPYDPSAAVVTTRAVDYCDILMITVTDIEQLREETWGDDGYELFINALRKQGEAHTKLVMKTTRRSSSSSLFQLGATARELAKRVGIPLRSPSSKGQTTPDPSTNDDTAGGLTDTQPS